MARHLEHGQPSAAQVENLTFGQRLEFGKPGESYGVGRCIPPHAAIADGHVPHDLPVLDAALVSEPLGRVDVGRVHVDGIELADASGVIGMPVCDHHVIREAGQAPDQRLHVVEARPGVDDKGAFFSDDQVLGVHPELVDEISVLGDLDNHGPGDGPGRRPGRGRRGGRLRIRAERGWQKHQGRGRTAPKQADTESWLHSNAPSPSQAGITLPAPDLRANAVRRTVLPSGHLAANAPARCISSMAVETTLSSAQPGFRREPMTWKVRWL